MDGRPTVSYSTGVTNPLLDKLTKLKNHPEPIRELHQHMESLMEDLDKFAGRRATDEQVKEWMKQVRELFHDIEDWIDLTPEVNPDDSEKQEIEDFKAQILEARERCTRYQLLSKAPTDPDRADFAASKVTVDSQLLLEEKTGLVVVDDPINELVKHLTDEEKMLKVVSIVGMEGLGKTTLAKEIYAKLQVQGKFECHAFVSVGRRPSMREILHDILRQIMPRRLLPRLPPVRLPPDVQQIITELRKCLRWKRYFILIDGVWSTWAWKVINCALPYNYCGSRALTTTCMSDVAKSCCANPNDVIYRMEALSHKNSRILLRSRILIREEEKPADFEEVSDNMLNMCGGMPLAIIVAAGLLATKARELAEPKMLGNFIFSPLVQYSASEGMTQILHMSYADLSLPLQSCFLYLGIFPEYYTIKKDRLIHLWGAEGFIPKIDKESLSVTGERYFNELISRRLIQPVFDYDDDLAVGCTVHGVILDFIRSLSGEENFATMASELGCGPFPCDTIRRFSLDCSNEDEAGTLASSRVHLSSMRSLIVFGDVEVMLDLPSPSVSEDDEENVHSPPTVTVNLLSTFKLIRVLDLEGTKNLKDRHLKGIGGLVLLRYLGLGGTGINRLPEEIGELEQLETLDLRPKKLWFLPASIVKLQKLVHLLLYITSSQIYRIWENQELEEVSNIGMYESRSISWVAELLSKSNRLRMLGVTFGESLTRGTNLVRFLEVVVKSNLHSLSLCCPSYNSKSVCLLADSWKKVTAPPITFKPQRFELIFSKTRFVEIPPDMASFVSLTHLRIAIIEVEEKDLDILGGLPNLVLLHLSLLRYAPRKSCIIKKGVFPCLKVLTCHFGGTWLLFQEGAMSQLQRFRLSIDPSRIRYQDLDFGIEHLTFLTRVHATILCKFATVFEIEAVEAHIRAQVSGNPNKPTLELSRA